VSPAASPSRRAVSPDISPVAGRATALTASRRPARRVARAAQVQPERLFCERIDAEEVKICPG
jgi:hypothetical protein